MEMEDIKGVMVTQPRTLNAKNIASFVADIVDVPLGKYVGYKYRHNNMTSKETIISYVTDGTLVQELYNKNGVFNYDVVIIDEVHERSLSVDILLMMIKNYVKMKLGSCKFIITSATLDQELFTKYFFGSKIGTLEIPGRAYPVKVKYLDESLYTMHSFRKQYDKKLIDVIDHIMDTSKQGDILIFVESKQQIDTLCYKIHKKYNKSELVCLPLYGGINKQNEELATSSTKFKSLPGNPKRKIVISTNVAESGVTVDGVLFVIDTGLKYEVIYKNRTDVLKQEFISKDSAEQRKGRAGRTAPGTCYRLFTANEFEQFDDHKSPEILVSNIDNIVISLLGTNFINSINDLSCFFGAMVTPPELKQVNDSLQYLFELRVIASDCNNLSEFKQNCKTKNSKTRTMECFTFMGNCIARLPLEAPLAIALLASYNYSVTDDVLILVSMLSVESNVGKWFVKPSHFDKGKLKQFNRIKKNYMNNKSDLLALLKIYEQFDKIKNKHQDQWKRDKAIKRWAIKNFIKYQFLFKTGLEIKRLKQQFSRIDTSCYIKNVAKVSKNKHDNIINAFLHGFFNQLAIRSRYDNEIYNIMLTPKKKLPDDIEIKSGKYNNITKLLNVIAFIKHANVLGSETLNGIINISKDTLTSLYDISPEYFGKDKIVV